MEGSVHPKSIVILDCGGQYAHLIGSRIRRLGVFTEVRDAETPAAALKGAAGIILSGGPQSVYDRGSPQADPKIFTLGKTKLVDLDGNKLPPHKELKLPYILKPGEYLLKLVPASGENLSPYELNLNLVSRASTVITRNFTQSDIDSSGYILQLVAESQDATNISIISDPDMISATIDGKPSGFTCECRRTGDAWIHFNNNHAVAIWFQRELDV